MLIRRVNTWTETNEQRQIRKRNKNNVMCINLDDPHYTGAGEIAEHNGDVTYVYIKH
jgi:hypothetical protein